MGDVLKNLRMRSQKRKKLLAQTVSSAIKWPFHFLTSTTGVVYMFNKFTFVVGCFQS